MVNWQDGKSCKVRTASEAKTIEWVGEGKRSGGGRVMGIGYKAVGVNECHFGPFMVVAFVWF